MLRNAIVMTMVLGLMPRVGCWDATSPMELAGADPGGNAEARPCCFGGDAQAECLPQVDCLAAGGVWVAHGACDGVEPPNDACDFAGGD